MSTFIYFISAGSSPIKIGLSDDPVARLAALQTAHYKKLHMLYTIECNERDEAFALEAAFHRWYADAQLMNEWFNISPIQIGADIELLMKLARTVVHVEQHTPTKHIRRLEEIKQKHRSNTHTGEVDNADMVIESSLYVITCPRCKKAMQGKPTQLQAQRALAAHIGKAHRKD